MIGKLRKKTLCEGGTIPIFIAQNSRIRRVGRVVECGGLENR
jgi:hypothetical protein